MCLYMGCANGANDDFSEIFQCLDWHDWLHQFVPVAPSPDLKCISVAKNLALSIL